MPHWNHYNVSSEDQLLLFISRKLSSSRTISEKRSNLEEEAISRIKRDPVTVDSRLALLLASGKVPSAFSLVPNDRMLNAKLIETCGISSSLRHE